MSKSDMSKMTLEKIRKSGLEQKDLCPQSRAEAIQQQLLEICGVLAAEIMKLQSDDQPKS